MMIVVRFLPLLSTLVLWTLLAAPQGTGASRVRKRETKKALRCVRRNGGRCRNDADCGRLDMCDMDMCLCIDNKCWLKKYCGEDCTYDDQCMDGACDKATMECICEETGPISTTEPPTTEPPTTEPPTTEPPTTTTTTTTDPCLNEPYVFIDDEMTWEAAKTRCEQDGMEMAMFKTDAEVQALKDSVALCVEGVKSYWIGMKQHETEYLKYKWMDNSDVPDEFKDNFNWDDETEFTTSSTTSFFTTTTITTPDQYDCMSLTTLPNMFITDRRCTALWNVICKK